MNKGVILWIHSSHGTQAYGGRTYFWDPQNSFKNIPKIISKRAGAMKEYNPWRAYDWELGSTEEPDTMSMDMKGIIPYTNHNSFILPATGLDWVLARKPIREFLVNRPILGRFFSILFQNVDNLYDGVTGSVKYSKEPLAWKTAPEIEEHLDNSSEDHISHLLSILRS